MKVVFFSLLHRLVWFVLGCGRSVRSTKTLCRKNRKKKSDKSCWKHFLILLTVAHSLTVCLFPYAIQWAFFLVFYWCLWHPLIVYTLCENFVLEKRCQQINQRSSLFQLRNRHQPVQSRILKEKKPTHNEEKKFHTKSKQSNANNTERIMMIERVSYKCIIDRKRDQINKRWYCLFWCLFVDSHADGLWCQTIGKRRRKCDRINGI